MTYCRREYLGALAGGAAVGLAGCQLLGGSGDAGGGDAGDEAPLYRNWIPELVSTPYRTIEYSNIGSMASRREALPPSVADGVGPPRSTFDEIDRLDGATERVVMDFDYEYFYVTRGDFGEELVEAVSTVIEENYEYRDHLERDGFEIYTNVVLEDTGHVRHVDSFGVSPSYYVRTPPNEGAYVEEIIEAGTGDRPALSEENDDVAKLFDAASGASEFTVETYEKEDALELGERYDGAPTGSKGALVAYEFGADSTTARLAFVFPDSDVAEPEAVETYLQESRVLAAYEDVHVASDGRRCTAEATVPSRRFNYLSQQTPDHLEEHLSVHFNPSQSYGGTAAFSVTSRYGADPTVIVRRNGDEVRRLESVDGRIELNVAVERTDVVTVVAVTGDGEEHVEAKYFA